MSRLWLVWLLAVAALPSHAQQHLARRAAHTPSRTMRLIAVGDIMMAGPMGQWMAARGRDFPFARIRPWLQRGDITFGNLECCVAVGGQPIPKKFNFEAKPDTVLALRAAGFHVVSLANNHAWDYGRDALAQTCRNVRQAGIVPVGAGINRSEAHALRIIRKNGLRVGFLAYLGLVPPLLPESSDSPCLAMGDVVGIRRDVQQARPLVDVLIVSLHCGEENNPVPTPRQRLLAHAAIEAGADLLIGHHPHVVQPMEIYRGKPICYSLGNFVFSTTGRGSGALLDAELGRGGKVHANFYRLDLRGGQPHLPENTP